jgi:hypothetical protein
MAAKRAKDKKASKPAKSERPKLIRDSFTMPEHDVARIKTLKQRCMKLGMDVKKSELLRAGLLAMEQLEDRQLQGLVNQVERLKPGRPAKKGD